jgi:hypothetical protein
MKSDEKVMEEWALDEIEFDGGGPIKVWTRHQFTRLVEALSKGNPKSIVSLWEGGTANGLALDAATMEVGHRAEEFLDWKKAEDFLKAVRLANRQAAFDSQWLAHHRSFNDAIKALLEWDLFDPRMIP